MSADVMEPRSPVGFALVAATAGFATLVIGCGGADDEPGGAHSRADKSTLPSSLRSRELVFVRQTGSRNDHLFVARPDGSGSRQLERGPGCKQRPTWSPDGRRIAFRFMPRCDYSGDQVVIIGGDGRGRFNLSRKTGIFGTSPSWSPDGKSISFAGMRTAAAGGRPDPTDEPAGIYIASTDGRQQRRITSKSLGEVQYPVWSPDGNTIAFQISRGESFELYSVAPDGSRLKRLTHNEGFTEWPMWSPDSKRIAYGVEGEKSALWVMDADGTHKRQIRPGVGVPASWAPGEWLVANCNLGDTRKIGVCAIAPDGSAQLRLLGGKDAGFASWRT